MTTCGKCFGNGTVLVESPLGGLTRVPCPNGCEPKKS